MTEPPITLARCILAITFVIVTALLVSMLDATEPVDPYCEMVSIWIESGGEYGWPDYRGNYHTECPATPLAGGAPSTQGEEK